MEQLNLLTELEGSQEVEASRKGSSRRRWTFVYYVLTVTAAVLAAIAGLGGLSALMGKTAAAWLALASAVVTAVNLSVRAKDQANQAANAESLSRSLAWEAAKTIAKAVDSEPKDPAHADEWMRWLSTEVDRLSAEAKETAQRSVRWLAAGTRSPAKLRPESESGTARAASQSESRQIDEPRMSALHNTVDKVERILVELGAKKLPLPGSLQSGRVSLDSYLLWRDEPLVLISDVKRQYEDWQEGHGVDRDLTNYLLALKNRMPGWALLVRGRELTAAEVGKIAEWNTWRRGSDLEETMPRLRAVVDAEEPQLKEALIAALDGGRR